MTSVKFDNGIEIALLQSGAQFLGLGQVTAAGVPVEFRTKRGHGNAAMRPWQER